MGKDQELDRAVQLYPAIEHFLCQGLQQSSDFQQSQADLTKLLS